MLTACVIIGREIAVSALREWMAELGERTRVAVSQLGKYKTILQMVGLSMMLYRYDLLGLPIYRIGAVLTVLAAVLTLWSMIAYIRSAWPTLTAARERAGSIRAARGPFRRVWRCKLLDLPRSAPTISPLFDAGIAQLVERNLAKVEVASSSLVSRSRSLHGFRLGGRVVMQRPAKPCTPVRFRP